MNVTRKNINCQYPPQIRREYYEFCRDYIKPSDVLSIQSTAVLHLKYMQYYIFHDKSPKLISKLSSLFSSNGSDSDTGSYPPLPPVLQYYSPPNLPMSTLCDPIELLRISDTLPAAFWSFNRFHIPSRPRLAPPPIRSIQREISDVERKALLTRRCKQRYIDEFQDDSANTLKKIMSKAVPRKTTVTRKRQDMLKITRNAHIPRISSPLRKAIDTESEETALVDRRDSKFDELEDLKHITESKDIISTVKKMSKSASSILPKRSNASLRTVGTAENLHKIDFHSSSLPSLWKTFTTTLSKLVNL